MHFTEINTEIKRRVILTYDMLFYNIYLNVLLAMQEKYK